MIKNLKEPGSMKENLKTEQKLCISEDILNLVRKVNTQN